MKLLELEITNVRGIRDKFKFTPNGKNFVIFGPNGSGKSGIVDALDFLLTGNITRLTGIGTGQINFKTHAPHIDSTYNKASVKGIIQLSGVKEGIEIERTFKSRNTVKYKKEYKKYLKPILEAAQTGQYLLTRREILQFITSKGADRAERIQNLLNIKDVELIRRTLVKTENSFMKVLDNEKIALKKAQTVIKTTIHMKKFSEKQILHIINKKRKILEGKPLSELNSKTIKKNLKPSQILKNNTFLNHTLLGRTIDKLSRVLSTSNKKKIVQDYTILSELISEVVALPDHEYEISRIKLTQLGYSVLPDSGQCPLCDIPWEKGKLRKYLEKRIESGKKLVTTMKKIEELRNDIITNLNVNILGSVEEILKFLKKPSYVEEFNQTKILIQRLKEVIEIINASEEIFHKSSLNLDEFLKDSMIEQLIQRFKEIHSKAKLEHPKITPKQMAWDTLTSLIENIKVLETAKTDYNMANRNYKRANLLRSEFIKARNNVLEKLYQRIKNQFVNLYKTVHTSDEDKFSADLIPGEASLHLEVDFFGRGQHPPHALHSEGHQDSMGLCLFFALSEELIENVIDFTILDDVLMSIDTNHRKKFCTLIQNKFQNKQFLITTHDKVWAQQLRKEGIVTSRNLIEFYKWDLEHGPYINNYYNIWDEIETYTRNNDVRGAAATLRWGLEQFFSYVCDYLKSQITFSFTLQWDFGELVSSAVGRYNRLLNMSLDSANSWGKKDEVKKIKIKEKTVKEIFKRTNVENWAINKNVHFNNWVNFSIEDFNPVIAAFKDLYFLFICVDCEGMIYTAYRGLKETSVSCPCGKVNWNLVKK